MSPTTATTTVPLDDMSSSGQLPADECAAYVYVGAGKFEPANEAAHEECRLWNDYADAINARTARRSLR